MHVFHHRLTTLLFSAFLPLALLSQAAENLIENGGFENGLSPWQESFGGKGCVTVVSQAPQSGKHCLQVVCQKQNSGVDFPRLRFGKELSRRGTYRLRAGIRNGGVSSGDFGLRLYFYSSKGEYLAMHSGISVRGEKMGEWKTGEILFGKDTKCNIPAGAATMMVRFSMWAQPGAIGTAWLDNVSLELISQKQGSVRGKPVAWVWQEKGQKIKPGNLPNLIEAGGFSVFAKSAEELCTPHLLSMDNLDLLVLAQNGEYPVELTNALPSFFVEGGALMTLGAPPFTTPMYQTEAGLLGLTETKKELLRLSPQQPWNEQHGGPKDNLKVKSGKREQRFSIDLDSYAYVGTQIEALESQDAILELEAKSDANTPFLCLELHEEDGSRWKRILPLSEEWTTHRIHLAEFAAYNSGKRGLEGDFLRGDRLRQLMVGFTRNMVGKGNHRFTLRKLRFSEAAVPGSTVVQNKRFASEMLTVTRWFGEKYVNETAIVPVPVPVCGKRETRARLRTLAGKSIGRENWNVWPMQTDIPAPAKKSGKRRSLERVLGETNSALQIPLVKAKRRFGDPLTCAVLTVNKTGKFTGSRWATFAISLKEEIPDALEGIISSTAHYLASLAWTSGPRPSFRVEADKILMDVTMPIANPSPQKLQLKVALQMADRPLAIQDVEIPAYTAAATDVLLARGLPAPHLESEPLCITVEVLSAHAELLGPRTFELDLMKQLRQVCDFMVEEAKDDTKLHGYSFIDNRGMRALLGGYEILGDKRYLKTALRWGETMVEEQREDGGYRMGYGIGKKGEECYVADGGEIVVGVLRLASYAKGKQRQRFLESADRYMQYREDFRVPTGGIGVGWCLNDYGNRPIVRLEKPTRIYAPEINTYTIGCSLAGAYAHVHIAGDSALERRAEKDADWLMARASRLNGAFVESYMFAHAFATTAERKKVYAEYLDRVFTKAMVGSYSQSNWWLSGGGRTALNLDGLAYVLHRLDGGPAVQAEIYRALCTMYSPQSLSSIPAVISGGAFDHDRWIYINFGTLGLVDILKPMVSIDGFIPQ